MQVSTNAGGSMEFVNAAQALGGNFFFAFRHLQVLSNELSDPKMLICPADFRSAAENFSVLRNENISYFVVPAAQFGHSDSMLAGDRNITTPWSSDGSVLKIGSDNQPEWTHELHDGQGNILFGDARVELFNNQKLATAVSFSKIAIPVYLPVLGPDNSVQAGGGRGSDASTGPGTQVGYAEGTRQGATASSESASTSGGLARLEQVFQQTPKEGKNPSAQSTAARPNGIAPKLGATSEGFSTQPLQTIANPKPDIPTNRESVTNPPTAQPGSATATAGDPWAIGIGQVVTRLGSRGAWWLLLLLLAGLVGIEIQRRRRARKKTGD
jgi:prepilin-type processing-associated H-X9-DG protein